MKSKYSTDPSNKLFLLELQVSHTIMRQFDEIIIIFWTTHWKETTRINKIMASFGNLGKSTVKMLQFYNISQLTALIQKVYFFGLMLQLRI